MGTHQRWLRKGLKIWADIVFFGGAAVFLLILVLGIIASLPVVGSGEWVVAVPVAIGEGTLRPVLSLPTGQDPGSGLSEVRIVDAGGELRVNSLRPGLFLGSLAFYWAALLIALWVVFLLRRILIQTYQGVPFSQQNVRDLSLIGWITLTTSAAGPVVEFFLSKWILGQVEISRITVSPPLNIRVDGIIFGLFILLLASVWKEAVLMAEEQSLTV
jgi:hypothetical protein